MNLPTISEESSSAPTSDDSSTDTSTTNTTTNNTLSKMGNPRSKILRQNKIEMGVHACKTAVLSTVDFLLKEHLHPDTKDEEECTMLHWAAINNNVEIIKLLLSHHANIDIIGGVLKATPLHWACYSGCFEAVVTLVVNGANPRILNSCAESPLHTACRKGNTKIIAYLLLKFDDIKDLRDDLGRSALIYAVQNGYGMFPIKTFVQCGAYLDFVDDMNRDTALHITIRRHDHAASVELLVGGANTEIKNNDNKTALEDLDEKALKRIKAPILFLTFCMFHFVHFFAGLTFVILVGLIGARLMSSHMLHDMGWLPPSYIVLLGGTEIVLLLFYTNGFVPWWILLVMGTFWTAGSSLFFILIILDPGEIKVAEKPFEFFVENVEKGDCGAYCFTCWVPKPMNSHHCSLCNKCFTDFDHHCPWINKCVYRKNMRLFVLFIMFSMIFCYMYTPAMGYFIYKQIEATTFKDTLFNHGFPIFITILSSVHIVGATMIFHTQISQISRSMTTIEVIRNKRNFDNKNGAVSDSSSSSASRIPIDESPTTRSRCKNLWNFFINDEF